jgi:hypothetical protein
VEFFFYIDFTGHGWGLSMHGGQGGTFDFEVPGTRTIEAPDGSLTVEQGHAIADAWNAGLAVTLPDGAVLHEGPAREARA